jgi:hypothetical protein
MQWARQLHAGVELGGRNSSANARTQRRLVFPYVGLERVSVVKPTAVDDKCELDRKIVGAQRMRDDLRGPSIMRIYESTRSVGSSLSARSWRSMRRAHSQGHSMLPEGNLVHLSTITPSEVRS